MITPNEKLTSCRHTRRIGIISALLLILFFRSPSFAQQPRLATGNWTRGLSGAWGHSWTPGYGKTKTDIQFVAFHPQLGRFVTDHLELYGEGSLFLYYEPTITVSGGVAAVGGRYHFWNNRDRHRWPDVEPSRYSRTRPGLQLSGNSWRRRSICSATWPGIDDRIS